MNDVSNVIDFPLRAARALTAHERLQALIAAQLNEEKADICGRDQPALRVFLLMNARLLRQLAS